MDSACVPIIQKQNSVFRTAEHRVPARGEGLSAARGTGRKVLCSHTAAT